MAMHVGRAGGKATLPGEMKKAENERFRLFLAF